MAASPRNQVNKERDPPRKPAIATRSLAERTCDSNSDHATPTAMFTGERVTPGKTRENRPFSIAAPPGIKQRGDYKTEAERLARTSSTAKCKARQHHVPVSRALSEPVLDKRRPLERDARTPTTRNSKDGIPKSILHLLPRTATSAGGILTSNYRQQERGLSVEAPKRYLRPVDPMF